MHVDATDRIIDFVEKPADPPGIPGNEDFALASMGIYVFQTKYLMELLRRDAADPDSSRDFGKDIIPLRGEERQSRRPPLRPVLRPLGLSSASPTGATSARSTPTGRPIST